jgi:hypothetical protein
VEFTPKVEEVVRVFWTNQAGQKYEYLASGQHKNWTEAEESCQGWAENAHLASF